MPSADLLSTPELNYEQWPCAAIKTGKPITNSLIVSGVIAPFAPSPHVIDVFSLQSRKGRECQKYTLS